MKTLIFEGAGWDKAEHNGVGNCRIRTRIRNNDGRVIYLEMGGTKFSGKVIPSWAKDFDFIGRIDSCFYDDAKWDKRSNHSKDLAKFEREHFEYTKENILAFVNEKLNCSFDTMEVINKGLYVHGTEDPLCDCSKPGYIPFKEIEIHISELKDVKSINTPNTAKYKINWHYVKKLPGLKEWIEARWEQEQKRFKNYNYYAVFRWNDKGIITDLAVTAKEPDFVHMGFAAEDIQIIIDAVKKSNVSEQVAV